MPTASVLADLPRYGHTVRSRSRCRCRGLCGAEAALPSAAPAGQEARSPDNKSQNPAPGAVRAPGFLSAPNAQCGHLPVPDAVVLRALFHVCFSSYRSAWCVNYLTRRGRTARSKLRCPVVWAATSPQGRPCQWLLSLVVPKAQGSQAGPPPPWAPGPPVLKANGRAGVGRIPATQGKRDRASELRR